MPEDDNGRAAFEYPVVYCAPGRKEAVNASVAAQGLTVSEIIEHAWLQGCDNAFVVLKAPEAFCRTGYSWEVLPDDGNVNCYFG